jgi:hypothetical protein
MASRQKTQPCSAPRAGEDVEWWKEEEILARIRCRLRALKESGCNQLECVVLAGRLDVDLERAIALIRRGCPTALAIRILA